MSSCELSACQISVVLQGLEWDPEALEGYRWLWLSGGSAGEQHEQGKVVSGMRVSGSASSGAAGHMRCCSSLV